MKIKGLTPGQVAAALGSVDTSLNFYTNKQTSDGALYGWLYYKPWATSPYKVHAPKGHTLYGPCFHMTVDAIRALLKAGATRVWEQKIAFKLSVTGALSHKQLTKLSAKYPATCKADHAKISGPLSEPISIESPSLTVKDFPIGTKVVYSKEYKPGTPVGLFLGATGYVVEHQHLGTSVGVAWEGMSGGHSCHGTIIDPPACGWFMEPENLRIVAPPMQGSAKFGLPPGMVSSWSVGSGQTCSVCKQRWGSHNGWACCAAGYQGSEDKVYFPDWLVVVTSGAGVPHTTAKPKPTKPPVDESVYTPLTAAKLDGPLPEGEVAGAKFSSKKRNIMPAVTGLYVLAELNLAIMDNQIPVTFADGSTATTFFDAKGNTVHVRRFRGECGENVNVRTRMLVAEFEAFKLEYERRLARNMLDYLTMACVGEARHARGVKWPNGSPDSREEAYTNAFNYDPRSILPVMQRVFGELYWTSGYGGPLWANIAKAAGYYFRFPDNPVVFIDHCVDLSHNGGLAFNKGYILELRDYSQSHYMDMLNEKRTGSLLKSYSTREWPVPADVWSLVRKFVNAGLIECPRATLNPVDDKLVPMYTWGTEDLTIKAKPGAFHGEAEAREEEEEVAERERWSGRRG